MSPVNNATFTVKVLSVEYRFSSTSCWSNTTGPGFTVPGGSQQSLSLKLPNSGENRTCVANGVSAVTPGFTIVSSNTPVSAAPGRTGVLTLVVQTPNLDVDQDLFIEVTSSSI